MCKDIDSEKWFNQHSLREIFQILNSMKTLTQEEQLRFKKKLLSYTESVGEPPDELCHWSGSLYREDIIIITIFFIIIFFITGLYLQWRYKYEEKLGSKKYRPV